MCGRLETLQNKLTGLANLGLLGVFLITGSWVLIPGFVPGICGSGGDFLVHPSQFSPWRAGPWSVLTVKCNWAQVSFWRQVFLSSLCHKKYGVPPKLPMNLSVTPDFIWIHLESPRTESHPALAQFARQIPAVFSPLLPSKCEQILSSIVFFPIIFHWLALKFLLCDSPLPELHTTTFLGAQHPSCPFRDIPSPCPQSEQHWDCTKQCVNIKGWSPLCQSPFQIFNFPAKFFKNLLKEVPCRGYFTSTAQINFSLASNEFAVKCWVIVNCKQFLEIKKLKDYMTRQPEVAYQPLEQRKQGIKRTAPVQPGLP